MGTVMVWLIVGVFLAGCVAWFVALFAGGDW